jgi:signal transduction histidine kinase
MDEVLQDAVLEELPAIVETVDCQRWFGSFLGAELNAREPRPEPIAGRSLFVFFPIEKPDSPAIAVHHRASGDALVFYARVWTGHSKLPRVDPWLDEGGGDMGYRGTAQSPTEQRGRERALRKAQEGLERQVTDRTARLAQANERLRHEIKERRQAEGLLLKERRYLRYLLELQDRDRQMVSYEIHDGLVQQLAAGLMQLEMFIRLTGQTDDEAGWKTFETGLQRLNECMREARRLINGLRSPILDAFGVVAAIEDLISQNGEQEKPDIEFVHHLDQERLAPAMENVIFRIVQECLTNARRYSQSDRVLVRVTQREDDLRIEVQDWGIGFDPRNVADGHFGLEGIQERARLFGGAATIKSALGKGTRIVVQLPLMGEVVEAQ